MKDAFSLKDFAKNLGNDSLAKDYMSLSGMLNPTQPTETGLKAILMPILQILGGAGGNREETFLEGLNRSSGEYLNKKNAQKQQASDSRRQDLQKIMDLLQNDRQYGLDKRGSNLEEKRLGLDQTKADRSYQTDQERLKLAREEMMRGGDKQNPNIQWIEFLVDRGVFPDVQTAYQAMNGGKGEPADLKFKKDFIMKSAEPGIGESVLDKALESAAAADELTRILYPQSSPSNSSTPQINFMSPFK